MRKTILSVAMAAALAAGPAMAQTHEVIPVWPGGAPGSENWTQKEGSFDLEDSRFTPPNPDTLVWNVVKPTLMVFKPAPGTANGAAIVVAPGGGFRVLSYKNEGTRVAQWLADHGITAFVLKYRLNRMPDDPKEIQAGLDAMMKAAAGPPSAAAPGGAAAPPAPGPDMKMGPVELAAISDGQEAVKLVRRRAADFGIDPKRIGIIGFSAGGAVSGGSAVGATATDRPNFVGVIYSNVRGEIPAGPPPAFLAAAADDPLSGQMPDLFKRWRAAGGAAEIHIYAKGQHGFGTAKQGLPVDHWLDTFNAWMAQQGFVPKPKA